MNSAVSPIELLEASLDELGKRVTLTERPPGTSHTAIEATGLDEPQVAQAFGRYAVGALAGAVDINASLQSYLLVGGVDKQQELRAEVIRLVSSTNQFTSQARRRFRDRWRNAWIAEIATHALLVVRARIDTACLMGSVRALSQPHPRPTRQGLDSVSIYEERAVPVVAIGETKASRRNGSGQLSTACDTFDGVDAGEYGTDLRQELIALRRALEPELREKVSEVLWREQRCYLPSILHQDPFDPDAHRDRLAALVPPVPRRRVLVLRFTHFDRFFDRVSDAMRAAVTEVIV